MLIAAFALSVIVAWRLTGILPGIVAAGSIMVVGLLLIRAWLITTARTHGYLLQRPQLGDVPRAIVLVGVFVGLALLIAGSFVVVGTLLA
jgi:hypothetical protein